MPNVTEDQVQEIWTVYNSHSTPKLADLMAEDVTVYDAISPIKGKAQFRETVEGWFKAFPDISYTRGATAVSGDTAVALYEASATFKAPLRTPDGQTLQPNNKRGSWTGAVVFQFNPQGKVRSIIDVYDVEDFAEQFGIELPG